jgi:hypothetical protein
VKAAFTIEARATRDGVELKLESFGVFLGEVK